MDLNNAIEKGYTMKFEPPYLRYVIGELKALDELLKPGSGEIELSVYAVEGITTLLEEVGNEIREIVEKTGRQIDDAPEPETEVQEREEKKIE